MAGAAMSLHHPLRELYLTRLREFYRQPARIFWVYGFPTVLAVVLGLAVKKRPPEPSRVDVVRNEATGAFERELGRFLARPRSRERPEIVLNEVTEDQA